MNTSGANTPGQNTPGQNAAPKRTAGLFDIRNMIGTLMGIYGVILLLMGFFGDPAFDRTGGVNANLWAGVVLSIVCVAMVLWAKLRPTLVPEGAAPEAGGEPHVGHH